MLQGLSGSCVRRRIVESLIVCAVTVGGVLAQADPKARAVELEQSLLAARVELATAALEKGLLREATTLIAAIRADVPDHPLGARATELKKMPSTEFLATYKAALERHARSFRKQRRSALAPIAKELVALGDAANKAGDPELAEHLFVRAYAADPSDDKPVRALRKLDYDVIFNYGALPKADKAAARDSLKKLRGQFMDRGDLKDELEYWSDAWGLQTRHYRFVTNADHTTVFAFAQACEDLHATWERWMLDHKQPLRKYSKPLRVFLFASDIDYETVIRLSGDDPLDSDDVLGYYSPQSKTGCFYYDREFYGDDRTLLFETFYHEGSHQLFDLRLKAAWRGLAKDHPLHWVEEGLCCYLETMQMTGDGRAREGVFGQIVDDDLATGIEAAIGQELLPSEDFVHQSSDDWDEYDLGYQHAALLIHWLLHGDDGKHSAVAFELLLAELQNAGMRKGSMLERLEMTSEQLDAALRAHAEQSKKALTWRKYQEQR